MAVKFLPSDIPKDLFGRSVEVKMATEYSPLYRQYSLTAAIKHSVFH